MSLWLLTSAHGCARAGGWGRLAGERAQPFYCTPVVPLCADVALPPGEARTCTPASLSCCRPAHVSRLCVCVCVCVCAPRPSSLPDGPAGGPAADAPGARAARVVPCASALSRALWAGPGCWPERTHAPYKWPGRYGRRCCAAPPAVAGRRARRGGADGGAGAARDRAGRGPSVCARLQLLHGSAQAGPSSLPHQRGE
jgi:hypothetical protein